jgi:hypothetical protein
MLLVQQTNLKEQLLPKYYKYQLLFHPGQEANLSKHRKFDHRIELTGTPRKGPICKLKPLEEKALQEYLKRMLDKRKIQPSSLSAGLPILFIPKNNSKSFHLCLDYKQLNKITIKDRIPTLLIDKLLAAIVGATYLTKLDMKNRFNLVQIKNRNEWKTAFQTKYKQFKYLIMPFGLYNALAIFQRMINIIFRELLDKKVVVFIDDIQIYSQKNKRATCTAN